MTGLAVARDQAPARATNAGFIQHLHAFRGFAIMTIVAAHSWSFLLFQGGFADMPAHTPVYALTEMLFHGSTIYFALISGLLYSLVLHERGWRKFFVSKGRNVLLPYAIVCLAFLSAFWPQYVQWFESEGRSVNFFVAYFGGMLTGTIQLQFWYIPVLAGLYALTPALAALLRRPGLQWLAFAIALLPLLVSRTIYPNLLSAQTLIYFTGAYMLGMLAGHWYEPALRLISSGLTVLWVTAVGSSAVLYLLFLNQYTPDGWHSLTQTLFYAQKIAIAALVVHAFARREGRLPGWLSTLGTYAFTIYFLHFMVVFGVASGIAAAFAGRENGAIALAGGLVIWLAAILLTTLVAALLKRLLGRYSRPIIGT